MLSFPPKYILGFLSDLCQVGWYNLLFILSCGGVYCSKKAVCYPELNLFKCCFQVVYLKGGTTMKEKNLVLKEINVPSVLVL